MGDEGHVIGQTSSLITLNNRGEMVMPMAYVDFTGPRQGLGFGTVRGFTNVFDRGEAVSGTGKFISAFSGAVRLNNSGDWVIGASTTIAPGTPASGSAILRGDADSFSAVLLSSPDPADPANTVTPGLREFNDHGDVTIVKSRLPNGRQSLNLLDTNNADTTIATDGMLIPGGTEEFDFRTAGPSPVLTPGGNVFFQANITGEGIAGAKNNGVFLHDGTSTSTVFTAGRAAPDGNGVFRSSSGLVASGDTSVFFLSDLRELNPGSSSNVGLFHWDNGAFSKIIRKGDSLPGGNGVFANSRGSHFSTNGSGVLAFPAVLQDTNGGTLDDSGIYQLRDGGIVEITREGSPAPSTSGGSSGRFDDVNSVETSVNELGQVAFLANLLDDAGGETDDVGLFFYDPIDGITAIARTDELLNGAVVKSLFFTPDISYGSAVSGLNDLGQVAFGARVNNQTGFAMLWTMDARIIGDANLDDVVNLADFGILRSNFGLTGVANRALGDFNGDGAVNLADFGILRSNFGSTTAADLAMMDAWAATVPETGIPIAGFAVAALGLRRWQYKESQGYRDDAGSTTRRGAEFHPLAAQV
ncbi:MAG: choice-of-anchor tandem repeat NxxGxxAF-containing protein [Planctomycetota bacterium]